MKEEEEVEEKEEEETAGFTSIQYDGVLIDALLIKCQDDCL